MSIVGRQLAYGKASVVYDKAAAAYDKARKSAHSALEFASLTRKSAYSTLESKYLDVSDAEVFSRRLKKFFIVLISLKVIAYLFSYSAESGLIDKMITKLLSYRTYIESPPLKISVDSKDSKKGLVYIVGSVPVPYMPTTMTDHDKYYRMECRFLSNMRLKWKRLKKITPENFEKFKSDNEKQQTKGKRIYKLENGKVNIYRSKEGLDVNNKMTSISMEKEITTFGVAGLEGEIITGGEDGIRKWELMREITSEEIKKKWEPIKKKMKEKRLVEGIL